VKRFTVAEDREFEIAGEVFKWVYPYWEDIATVFDRDAKEVQDDVPFSVRATIADFIERIELFLDPENDSINRWRLLTKRKKNPIPHSQYAALYQWLLEVTSAPTPTEQSSPSEDGQRPVVATSTAASS
jgi:hypothetical protein